MRGLLAVLLVGPALFLGVVHASILAVFLIPAAALLAHMAFLRRYEPVRIDLVGAVFIGLILFTLFQLIPLPSVVVKFLSPAVYDVRSRALAPLGGDLPSFMQLTLDAGLTALELGKLLIYTSVYLACRRWVKQQGARYILGLIVATGVAAAAIFLAHKILLLDKIYGIYTPMDGAFGSDRSTAPLINENHMAALLGLCAAVAIGRALATRERSERALMIGLAGLIGGSLLLTISRGGIAAFVAGQCLFVVLRVITRRTRDHSPSTPLHLAWLPLGLVLSLGLGLFVAQDVIFEEFISGDVKKLDLALEGVPLIGQFWTTGVGRGAFWVGLPLVSDISTSATFTHAENAVVQILADYGLVVGLTALAVCCIAVGRFLVNPPTRIDRAAALAALVAFGLHNLVDFNMEIPGVAVLAAALLGTLTGSRKGATLKYAISRPILITAAGGTLITSAIIGLHVAAYTVENEQHFFYRAWTERDNAPFSKENLAAALSRHPADWYIPFVVGVRTFHLEKESPLPWMARAIELNSASAPAHFYAGRAFLRAGKLDQALLELRLSAVFNPRFADPVATLLVAEIPRFASLRTIARAREDKLLLFGALARAFETRGHPKEAEAADRAVIEIDPQAPDSLARQARRLAMRGETQAALHMATTLSKLPGLGPLGVQIQADIFEMRGRPDLAVAALKQALMASPRHRGLLTRMAWAKQRAGDYAGALEATSALRAISSGIKSSADVAVLEGNLAKAAGRIQTALARFREAHIVDPTNSGVLIEIADLAKRIGDERRMIEALKKLSALDPHNETVKERLNAIEEADRRNALLNQ
ncbi:MAG: hypothetical protein QNJ97_08200 [Myxococcota bacterium]|nr:hypothetical protein [Myxococcota bacterium]